MIIDNDGIYGDWITKVFKEFEIDIFRIPKGAPWCNGITERMHFSIKNEVLLRVPLEDDMHVNLICRRYQTFFNKWRPHQSLGGKVPSEVQKLIPVNNDIENLRY